MQRQRSALDSFPEPLDLNQGSLPGSTSMDQSASWENILNPVENRLSSYMLTPADGTVNCMAPNNCPQTLNHWGRGKSSSGAGNVQDEALADKSKMTMGWPASSFDSRPGSDASLDNLSLEPSTITSAGYVGNGTFQSMHGRSSNYSSPNIRSNRLIMAYDHHNRVGSQLSHSFCKPGHSETEPIPALNASSSNIGTSLGGFTFLAPNDASGQFCHGGSSSSNQPKEKNALQHLGLNCHAHAGGLGTWSLSSDRLCLTPINQSQRLNCSSETVANRIAPVRCPSSSFAMRLDHRQHGPVPFDAPGGPSVRNLGVYTAQMSTPASSPYHSEMQLPVHQNNQNHPYVTHVNEAGGICLYTWEGSCGSLGDSLSSSYMVSQERGSGAREQVNVQSSHRNHVYLTDGSTPEARNIPPDEIDWSFAPAMLASSRNGSSSSWGRISSGGQSSSATWLPYQRQASQNHNQLLEPAPWFPGSDIESESEFGRSPYPLLPSLASSEVVASSSQASRNQLAQNSAAFLMAIPRDEFNGWCAMTGVEGRHRLIRQVLNGRRRARVQSEDYMFADPSINGFAELHDRHRDMRLDVDNMSYEELLALEERIGNVSTGLSEEKIQDSIKQRNLKAIGVSPNLEPCCICQENYVNGDDIGILECGHEFHTGCIKQWLSLKNLCPICKIAALET